MKKLKFPSAVKIQNTYFGVDMSLPTLLAMQQEDGIKKKNAMIVNVQGLYVHIVQLNSLLF